MNRFPRHPLVFVAIVVAIVLVFIAAAFALDEWNSEKSSEPPKPEPRTGVRVSPPGASISGLDGIREAGEAYEAARWVEVREWQAAVDAARPEPVPVVGGTGGDPPSGNCAIPAYICERESGFDPRAVSPDGLYRGKYQFLQSTWNSTAQAAGRPDLVGVLPDQASEADQDALAAFLWAGGAGCSHWNAC